MFDGTSPPYEVDAVPHPVQLYGESKLSGERAVLGMDDQGSNSRGQRVVLRVPVLYGPCRQNSDTAVNVLLDVVRDQSGKTYKMGECLLLRFVYFVRIQECMYDFLHDVIICIHYFVLIGASFRLMCFANPP